MPNAQSGFFEWVLFLAKSYAPLLLRGAGVTLLLALSGTLVGFLIGLGVGVVRSIPCRREDGAVKYVLLKIVRGILSIYIEVFRSTPMIVQAMVIYYGIAQLFALTLNQLLAELDGFDPSKGVIVLGATNRPEVLDKALLRPGRFDRRITVDRPNLAGRLATLQVHTRNIRLAEDVNLEKIAQATAGCVGADLANLVNEAALRAVRKGRRAVNQDDLLVSFELVIAGSEKKGTVITEAEKRIIAYHEVGHALVAAKQKNAQPVSKITIVPHTQGALGYTLHLPEEEKFLMSREDILTEIRTLLAGRSSEEVVCNTMTSGAANDIERATEMARNLVARFGMCDEFDMMALGSVQSQYLDGGYSMTCAQETYAAADRETIKILRQCHEEAKQILRENRELLDKIAAYLLKKETITGQEMMAIIEGRDPETVDNYGASKSSQPAFRPSVPETIEAPARHINIVSEPIPMPDYDEKPEDKDPESTPAGDKPAEHADGDPE